MDFFKKNPKIKGAVCVQGYTLDDESVVIGEEFKMFANPKTFHGRDPMLVPVAFEELSEGQKATLEKFMATQKPKPPRHLGPITSANFDVSMKGEARIKLSEPVRTAVAPTPEPEPEPEPDEETAEVAEEKGAVEGLKEEPSTVLTEIMSTKEMVDEFPGITNSNVSKIIKKFKTLEDLVEASNVDLRSAKVRPNFYNKVREAAEEKLKEIGEGE